MPGWGGFTTGSQVGFPLCGTMPWLRGAQGLVLVGCSPCGCIYPVLLLLLSAHRQELGFLPYGLVWIPLLGKPHPGGSLWQHQQVINQQGKPRAVEHQLPALPDPGTVLRPSSLPLPGTLAGDNPV